MPTLTCQSSDSLLTLSRRARVRLGYRPSSSGSVGCQRLKVHCSPVKGPLRPLTQTSLSDWERSTEEDRNQIEDLQAAFREADRDGNGVIDREELSQLLREGSSKLDPLTLKWISDAGISNIMDSFDGNADGSISFDEFASLARAGSLLNGKFAEYRQAFNEVDTSGNGTIGSSEIQQLFQDLGQPLSETKLWKIFDKYDQNRNGQIDFPEFLELFKDELLDLHAILQYLEMHPRKGQPKQQKLVEARLGLVTLIFSEAELDSLLVEHANRLVVLEASLTWCRPCKGFEKTFQKFAEAFSETLFLKFYGNSNEDCKHLIEERLQVPLTPTFTLFRKGAPLSFITGANRRRLYEGLMELLLPDENPLTKMNPFQQQVWRSKLGLG